MTSLQLVLKLCWYFETVDSVWFFFGCRLEKPSQNSENEQSSVSLEVLLVKVCHKKRKVKFQTSDFAEISVPYRMSVV